MPAEMTRRDLLRTAGGLALVAALRHGAAGAATTPTRPSGLVLPGDPAVEARDAKRRKTGAGKTTATIIAAPVTVMIGGRSVSTWAFGPRPGDGGLRAKAGDLIEVTFTNRLPSANTIHWHGIALRNDMDGVHDLTQAPVATNQTFTYRFTAPDPGTYWFHPHMGLELDKGLYAPLIIEDPNDATPADVDVTLMLDDWLDGYGRTQQQVLDTLRTSGHAGHSMGNMGNMGHMGSTGSSSSGGMGGMGGMGGSGGTGTAGLSGMGTLAGDVSYPLHVINGRGPKERQTVTARPGQKIRLRLINAGSDTAYRFAVADHQLTVTHADGFPIRPVAADNVLLGMGERYDVIVTAKSGAFAIIAVPEGKTDPAGEAVLRTTTAAPAPATGTRPAALNGRTPTYADLQSTDATRLPKRAPTRTTTLNLTATPSGYVHGINGRSFPDSTPVTVHQGERLRLRIVNQTMMFHPIHLHGHTFQLVGSTRKDTVNIPMMGSAEFDIDADNPGQWMLHCHNTYHLETGMATTLSYRN